MPELTAKLSAITTTSRVYPFLNPARLGQSQARETFLRAMPTSYSFIRRPSEMIWESVKAISKLATFQRPSPTEGNSLKLLLTMAASALVVSALSQALDAHRRGDDIDDAIWEA